MSTNTSIDFSSSFWNAKYLLIDSRMLTAPSQTIFFALNGPKREGSEFIPELYDKGVRKFVVTVDFDKGYLYKEATFVYVENTLQTLQEVTKYHRELYPDLPVIGITGSNAKTIIKEWLYTLLEVDKNVVKSPKSYNSQIGVPLSVWQIDKKHELGIFEAGISKIDEMKNLQRIILPSIGLFTNLGSAHDKLFDNRVQKLHEKGFLFDECHSIIYCRDHEDIHEELRQKNGELFHWGVHQEAALRIEEIENQLVYLNFKGNKHQITIPFNDEASFENAMHCVAVLTYLGYSFEEINRRLSFLKSLPMRLERKEGINGTVLINDFYNNDLGGLQIALSFMGQNQENLPKTLILSDLLQGHNDKTVLYQKINELIHEHEIERFIGVGNHLSQHQNDITIDSQFFKNTSELKNAIRKQQITFNKEMILLKGARQYEFEKIAALLQRKIHSTRLEINLDAVVHNLMFYKAQLQPSTKVMVMVKALGYGSGKHELAHTLQYHLVDYLGVAFADEGVELRENGIRTPIMVLTPSPDSFETMRRFQLEPEIYNLEMLEALEDFLEEDENETPFAIQINIDTGMHRLGFTVAELPILLEKLGKIASKVKVTGVFTHLAGADEEQHNNYTLNQVQEFDKVAASIEDFLGYKVIKHCLNSAGIVRFPEHQMDMVRLGIGLHGIEVNRIKQDDLQTVATLKSVIAQIKTIKKGETIGYGRKGVASKDMKIATIGIGYADGFNRHFSNGVGKMIINGKIAPVIGNVCMDMTMVDITDINAIVGDDVVIFGEDLSITQLAKAIDTIPYEILTSVSSRVKRVYYMEG
ncbi:bifunctional UDP-N-acetylmuramoyl-tripeptide:D-alanyl-D-alanine ligase/alanine racemase [Flammeovirga yaeyamensis]|uniref:Alanine racemase n=1 Tax=Flammeovirga yaeyamensis TaxID=367791 RepID=A0AAX1N6T2_9BACT|nr:bifunctional UDP-N-acetylmuramoyl-tripeptide:D-alanyl-D-alanine ligase/alanine racemase [Flammeovirga yaeyamensis]MBB3697790.1 alanine racemase [Flammeovirga yaeyamensis]NMF35854.1 bifunctional UDP-N-acetylmuramoyl-tripeptide:D-alanyl-D-alanine ligase/alanine racemase [Flammeovirga yaeyamensis]QWG03195.1 bifunctional UDP-N-acetylmuramoyl-tripeptide:D-alanyl-D-alanine ligase/alanine racemase [Flammeovirga yaeyamensis]